MEQAIQKNKEVYQSQGKDQESEEQIGKVMASNGNKLSINLVKEEEKE